MANNDQFVTQIRDFINTATDNIDRIYKDSIEDMALQANLPVSQGGRMPVVTGQLMESICATSDGGSYQGTTSFATAIHAASPLSAVRVGWTAPYATAVEFGTGATTPRAFARGAAFSWEAIVEINALRINP